MQEIQQSTTTDALTFFMADSTDGITGKTGLTPTVTLSKNGGSFASPAGAVTEIASGWYKVAGNATDSNTLGALILHATASGADPADVRFAVVAHSLRDAVRGTAGTALPNAAAEASGGLYTRGTGAGQINQAANGQVDVNLKAAAGTNVTLDANNVLNVSAKYVGGTLQTARDLGASVLLSVGTAAGQVNLALGKVPVVQLTSADFANNSITAAALAADAAAEIGAAVLDVGYLSHQDLGSIGFAIGQAYTILNTFNQNGVFVADGGIGSATFTAGAITAGAIADGAFDGKGDWVLSGSYTAPDNAAIAAIKAKTDQFVFTLANQVDANALTGGGGGAVTEDTTFIEEENDFT